MVKVIVVLSMSPRPRARMDAVVVPAFSIYTVYAAQLQPSTFQLFTEYTHHAAIFPLVILALGGWENQHFCPAVTKNQEFHIAVQRRAVPTAIFTVHEDYCSFHISCFERGFHGC